MPRPDPQKPRGRQGGNPREQRRNSPPRQQVQRGREDRRAEPTRKPLPPTRKTPPSWGSLARKGTRWLDDPGETSASAAWRDAVARARGVDAGRPDEEAPKRPPKWQPDVWVDEGRQDDKPRQAKRATKSTPRKRLPRAVVEEVESEVGPIRAGRLAERLAEATKAYERDRYRDAAQFLKPLVDRAPGSAAVRELYGLTLYRLGRWNEAAKQFEAFHELTGSFDQHPALADCYRAKKRWKRVADLWEELRTASPGAEVVAEGRIVAAGALADQGNVSAAIELLERAKNAPRRPKEHHLRLWYALADLYERAGDMPRARELFRTVADHDPELADVSSRVAALR